MDLSQCPKISSISNFAEYHQNVNSYMYGYLGLYLSEPRLAMFTFKDYMVSLTGL